MYARSATFVATLGLLRVAVAPAHAAFPGSNGKIAYTYKDYELDTTSVCAINQDGTGDQCLAEGQDPAWLSSGARLAFTTFDGDIATMNEDGTGVARVATTPEIEFEPTVAPSGLQFAFTVSAGGTQQIYKIDSDGTDRIPLTSSSADSGAPACNMTGARSPSRVAETSSR